MKLELIKKLLARANDAIVISDQQGNIRFWNQQSEQLLGFESEEVLGRSLQSYITQDPNSPLDEVNVTKKDGASIWLERSVATAEFEGGCWQISIMRSIDVRRQRMEELQREASTDSVSGLLNRREFQRQLELHLGDSLTLAIVDIDNFKEINDQFGHWVGDEGIRFIAKNLTDLFPQAICIARLGGDEFGVLCVFDSVEQAKSHFEDFRNQSIERAPEAHLKVIPKVSIGVAFSSSPNTSARELLTQADRLMYLSKKQGGNRTTVAII